MVILKLTAKIEPFPTNLPTNHKDTTRETCNKLDNAALLDDVRRLGTNTLCILATTTVIIFGLRGLLAYLWFGQVHSGTWKQIMVNGWATRSIAVIPLMLRTTIDLQTAIGSAIVASLLLESRSGVKLHHLATVSPIRAGTTSLWALARCACEDLWGSSVTHRLSNYRYCLAAGILIITTSILQFSSTILLSDLRSGPLIGHEYASQVRPGLSYSLLRDVEKIPRDSAWTSNPAFYPVYAEYHEPSGNGVPGTGSLLRALLPYATAESRQTLSSYRGNALILDARVTCQAPTIADFVLNWGYRYTNGTVGVSEKESEYGVSCMYGDTTICQLTQRSGTPSGLMRSQFENSTAFGAAFLVTKEDFESNNTEKWLHLPKENISVSLCHAPWDAAVLDVTLIGDTNRTEPMLQYDRSSEKYETSAVVEHFLPTGNSSTRQVMVMQKPHSLLGDLPPPQRRPVVQSDMGGKFALAKGGSGPLPGHWTAFMSEHPLITMLRRFARDPTEMTNVMAADPALAAIFNDALQASSVSWAMSTLITILSMSNYYGQQAAFDRLDNVTVSFFENVLYPRDYVGFTLLLWALAAHFVTMAILVVMFVRNTRSTLLGNAWSALAQIIESQEVKEHVIGANVKSDSEMLNDLKGAHKEGLRARVVRRGGGAEVVVQ